jgi:hypothetical protein
VDEAASAAAVVGYCNAWHEAVRAAGYLPGLYVGYGCGLTGVQLYKLLRFDAYWAAYNLDRDQYPARRGVQMRQLPYPVPTLRINGCPFEYDEDFVLVDALGGTPAMVLP